MNTFEDFLDGIIRQYDSLDISEHEFRKLLQEDPELREEYKVWCEENGFRERTGFTEYFYNYVDNMHGRMQVLDDDNYEI